MKKFSIRMLAVLMAFLLSACATASREMPVAYDLGPLRAERIALLPGTPVFLLSEASAPEWLDGMAMHYRLAYVNDQQALSYAHSRWSMAPAKLLEQRLKARISQDGGVVLRASSGASNSILLRLELEDFSQRFDAVDRSVGQVALRISALKGRTLLAQKTFTRTAFAPSADASGGAKALAQASDDLIGEVMAWLARLPAND